MSGKVQPVEERFWRRVTKTDTCWLYDRPSKRTGYGIVRFSVGHDRPTTRTHAHRFSYELHVGPVPEGLVLDHLCRVKNCVNPDHLEPVTPRENVLRSPTAPPAINARKTHCPAGHAYTEHGRVDGKGHRFCVTCNRIGSRARLRCAVCGKRRAPSSMQRHLIEEHGQGAAS